MTKVVGVRFKDTGKTYFFDPEDLDVHKGDTVIVETARGVENGIAASGIQSVDDDEIVSPLKPIIRIANANDMQRIENNKQNEKKENSICLKKIDEHKPDMSINEVK